MSDKINLNDGVFVDYHGTKYLALPEAEGWKFFDIVSYTRWSDRTLKSTCSREDIEKIFGEKVRIFYGSVEIKEKTQKLSELKPGQQFRLIISMIDGPFTLLKATPQAKRALGYVYYDKNELYHTIGDLEVTEVS